MSTYEELTLIVNVAMLIIAILVYTNSKGTKKYPPRLPSRWLFFPRNWKATLWSWLPFVPLDYHILKKKSN